MALKYSEIYVFATDSRAGRLLEMNAWEKAGLRPLYAQSPRIDDVVTDHIAWNSARTIPIFPLAPANIFSDIGDQLFDVAHNYKPAEFNGIAMPAFSRSGNGMNWAAIDLASNYPNLCLVNGSYEHQLLYNNKGIMTEVAMAAGAQNLPYTRNYVRSFQDSDETIHTALRDFSGYQHVVIKPFDAQNGDGIFVTPYNKLGDCLNYMFQYPFTNSVKKPDRSFPAFYWDFKYPTGFQLQEYADSYLEHGRTLFSRKTKIWGATTRIVWSALIGYDDNNERKIELKAHAGFHQLPRTRLPIEPDQDSTLSFSYPRGPIDALAFLLTSRFTGARSKVVIQDADELEREAAPVRDDLQKTFSYIDQRSLSTLRAKFATSVDPVLRLLAKDFPKATDTENYRRGRVVQQPQLQHADPMQSVA